MELDELHEILIMITSDIHLALSAEDVPYYVVGGSAIGCVRDKGHMVPWDDDVDIVFEDKYSEAVKYALEKHLSGKYILEFPNTKENHKGFFRVIQKNTCLIRNTRDRNDQGISVELFPMVDIPDDAIRKKMFFLLVKGYILLDKAGNFIPRPLIMVCIGFKKALKMALDKLSLSKCSSISSLNGLFFVDIVPKKYFSKPTTRILEGQEFYFPEFLEDYLEKIYGNYMDLPPEDKRKPTYLILDTKNSWTLHLEEAKKIERERRKM